jgi:TPR repeat protein
MNNLGYYYQFIEKDYELMKKYYLIAIDKGHSNAMNNLGYYLKYLLNALYFLHLLEAYYLFYC